jgi:hypothetical protein
MALLDRVKERTGTDLSDTEITAMIAGIAAEIALLHGPARVRSMTWWATPQIGTAGARR